MTGPESLPENMVVIVPNQATTAYVKQLETRLRDAEQRITDLGRSRDYEEREHVRIETERRQRAERAEAQAERARRIIEAAQVWAGDIRMLRELGFGPISSSSAALLAVLEEQEPPT